MLDEGRLNEAAEMLERDRRRPSGEPLEAFAGLDQLQVLVESLLTGTGPAQRPVEREFEPETSMEVGRRLDLVLRDAVLTAVDELSHEDSAAAIDSFNGDITILAMMEDEATGEIVTRKSQLKLSVPRSAWPKDQSSLNLFDTTPTPRNSNTERETIKTPADAESTSVSTPSDNNESEGEVDREDDDEDEVQLSARPSFGDEDDLLDWARELHRKRKIDETLANLRQSSGLTDLLPFAATALSLPSFPSGLEAESTSRLNSQIEAVLDFGHAQSSLSFNDALMYLLVMDPDVASSAVTDFARESRSAALQGDAFAEALNLNNEVASPAGVVPSSGVENSAGGLRSAAVSPRNSNAADGRSRLPPPTAETPDAVRDLLANFASPSNTAFSSLTEGARLSSEAFAGLGDGSFYGEDDLRADGMVLIEIESAVDESGEYVDVQEVLVPENVVDDPQKLRDYLRQEGIEWAADEELIVEDYEDDGEELTGRSDNPFAPNGTETYGGSLNAEDEAFANTVYLDVAAGALHLAE